VIGRLSAMARITPARLDGLKADQTVGALAMSETRELRVVIAPATAWERGETPYGWLSAPSVIVLCAERLSPGTTVETRDGMAYRIVGSGPVIHQLGLIRHGAVEVQA
jgi:hypothetical protein